MKFSRRPRLVFIVVEKSWRKRLQLLLVLKQELLYLRQYPRVEVMLHIPKDWRVSVWRVKPWQKRVKQRVLPSSHTRGSLSLRTCPLCSTHHHHHLLLLQLQLLLS